jgi:hypothetical protein
MREKGIGYIPDPNDTIDKKLAEYLNQQSDLNNIKVFYIS